MVLSCAAARSNGIAQKEILLLALVFDQDSVVDQKAREKKEKEDNKRDEQMKRLAATSILKIENMVVQLDALRCNANFTAVSAVVAAPIKDAHDTFSAWLLACKACIDGDVTERSSGI